MGLRPSRHDWETHRQEIEELYLKQHKTLRQVIQIMNESYGLKAT